MSIMESSVAVASSWS